MKVFLSYALPQYDELLPSRLRANAIGYGVEVLIPRSESRSGRLAATIREQILNSSAVIAFVAQHAPESQIQSVNVELSEATLQGKPVVAMVESHGLVQNLPPDRVVIFDRLNYGSHERRLHEVLNLIQQEQKGKELVTALAALGLIAIGLYTFGELTKD